MELPLFGLCVTTYSIIPQMAFSNQWSMCKAPQTSPAVTSRRQQEVISYPRWRDSDIYTCGSRTPRCDQLVLVERDLFLSFADVVCLSFHCYVVYTLLILKFNLSKIEVAAGWRFGLLPDRMVLVYELDSSRFCVSSIFTPIPYDRRACASTIYYESPSST